MRPEMMSDMWTSMASKPAAWNDHAISMCPLTPCSRRIATRGLLPDASDDDDEEGESRNLNGTLYAMPGLASSLMPSYSCCAHDGSSRIDCILKLVSAHVCCRSARVAV